MNFLPEDYEAPKANSGYLKLQEGENRIRILTHPILGWEDWQDKKPIRFRMYAKPKASIDPKKPFRHFWAFVIWDYTQQKICIMELTQATIRNRIETLSKDTDWGAPFHYDIKIIKKGNGTDTEYEINPVSHKELDPKIKEEFMRTPIELEALYISADPFSPTGPRTKAFWELVGASVKDSQSSDQFITPEQVAKLETEIATFIAKDDPHYRERALAAFKVANFNQLTQKAYNSVLQKIEEKKGQLLKEDEVPF